MTTRLESIDDELCRRFLGSVEFIGQRWSSGILLALGRGSTRFSEVVASVDGLSDRMAAQRLKELGAHGLVVRSIVPSTPVQVRYHLTDRGRELLDSLQPLAAWTARWTPDADRDLDEQPQAVTS